MALAAPLLSACGARLSQGTLERNIGHATDRDIADNLTEILRRHGYIIYNSRRTSENIYFETNWRPRGPFDDEAALGVEEARTRIIIRGRRSSPTLYTVRLQAQNQVRGVPDSSDLTGSSWVTIPATEEYGDYIRDLTTEIQMEVDAGQRRRS